MIEHRPIKNIKPLLKEGVINLSKTEYRFLKLLNELKNPLTNEKIISFYQENVQRYDGRYEFKKGEWIVVGYSDNQVKIMALAWFDRNLGCMIRKQMLSEKGNIKLNDLMLTK